MSAPIEDYAIIGDCESVALVGRDGSIDWLCWPRFDSDACFAALLGTPEHGRFLIAPEGEAKVTRRYRPNTLVLETRFETADGVVTLTDCMPLRDGTANIVRQVHCERGCVPMQLEPVIRFGYGAVVPWVTRIDGGLLRAVAGPDMLLLRSSVSVRGKGMKSVAAFSLRAGQTADFVLTYGASHLPPPPMPDPAAAIALTEEIWARWAARSRSAGPYSEAVVRSLITLKALSYAPTGGIIAAPTTSLPEQVGGPRNWDYRFCWVRDATLTLLALMNGGFYGEAQKWRDWLLRAVAGSPGQMQIMYGIAGERRLTEWEVPWLPGYANSKPVRIGNAAHVQLQIDVYGEVMAALHHARLGGLAPNASGWDLEIALLSNLEKIWREPDEGIWEVRGERRHFTHSKVMAWVAFDRAIKSAERFKLDGPIDRWRALRVEIQEDVCRKAFDEDLNSFVRSYGSRELDASLLLIPASGFLPADDPRVRGTIAAIEKALMVDGFVKRYDTHRTDDGLPPGEGAFLACSFWLVDVYTLVGRMEDARAVFDRLLSLRNDVGLLSEEYDPIRKRLVGNFPQGFSHVGLINSAFNLTREEKPAEQLATSNAPREAATAK